MDCLRNCDAIVDLERESRACFTVIYDTIFRLEANAVRFAVFFTPPAPFFYCKFSNGVAKTGTDLRKESEQYCFCTKDFSHYPDANITRFQGNWASQGAI